jgi:hypothetical protein
MARPPDQTTVAPGEDFHVKGLGARILRAQLEGRLQGVGAGGEDDFDGLAEPARDYAARLVARSVGGGQRTFDGGRIGIVTLRSDINARDGGDARNG